MASNPNDFHHVRCSIYPNKKEVASYMAFHTVFVSANQFMRFVLAGDAFSFLQLLQNIKQSYHKLGVTAVLLQALFLGVPWNKYTKLKAIHNRLLCIS